MSKLGMLFCLVILCATSADAAASPTDFGNAFPGWAGQSCVIPTP